MKWLFWSKVAYEIIRILTILGRGNPYHEKSHLITLNIVVVAALKPSQGIRLTSLKYFI